MQRKMNKKIETGLEIAVIGMAGRFPQSENVEILFENLTKGKELISFFEDEELIMESISSELLNDEQYVKAKGVIKDDDKFDSQFFGYTPRDAEIMDPQIRLFHECAWSALEDAGYIAEEYKGNIGLYAAASGNMAWQQYIYETYGEFDMAKPYANRDFLAMIVAYKLDLKGPVYMVNTACSSSLVAIHEACRSILMGESKMMLAGGVSLSFPQKKGYRYQEDMIMAKDGHLRPFDLDSNGAVGGSGVGVVVLKALKHAIADGDHIYAVIRGSAVNNDGNRKVGFSAPSVEGQRLVIAKAMKMAGGLPQEMSFVETHGTGTKLGDPTEITALCKAYQTDKRGYCAIGAVKANIGHLDVAAGIAGFIKTVMVLHKRIIPPLINFTAPNLDIPFLDTPFYIPREKIDLCQEEKELFAGVSSFGIGGTNAHIVLQEYENDNDKRPEEERERYILLSSSNEEKLKQQRQNLADYLAKHRDINLSDLEYTLQVGRKHFDCRIVLCGKNLDEIINQLREENHTVKKAEEVHLHKNEMSHILGATQEVQEPKDALKDLIERWVQGENIDFKRLYKDKRCYRIPLPTYPFVRNSYKRKREKRKLSCDFRFEDLCSEVIRLEDELYQKQNISSVRKNKSLYHLANKLCAAYIYNYFTIAGIEFAEGKQYTFDDIMKCIQVLEKYEKMIRSFLTVLEEENILIFKKDEVTIKKVPGQELYIGNIKSQFSRKYPEYTGLTDLIEYCCQHYQKALSGEINALNVLFPDGVSIWGDEKYQIHVQHSYCDVYKEMLKRSVIRYIEHYGQFQKIKILEVGSGNGILTKSILPDLAEYQVEYYFTDIGNYFLEKGKRQFMSEEYPFVQFKKFDITQNPLGQGFEENVMDIVIGLNVVHATKNIKNSLENMKCLLKPNGMMGLIESIHNERWYNMIDGLAEGWWYFEDTDLRKAPLVELGGWRTCFQDIGLRDIYTFPANTVKEQYSDMGMIIGKKVEKNRSFDVIQSTEEKNINVTSGYGALVSEKEMDFAEAFSEFLGIEQIGIHDNFYELGIDSIIAIQISSKLQKQGYKIKLDDILKYPTIDELAKRVAAFDEEEKEIIQEGILLVDERKDMTILEAMRKEDNNISLIYPLSPMQEVILGQNTLSHSKGLDVFALLFDLYGEVDAKAFHKTWNRIMQKHSILRTSFVWRKLTKPVQIVYDNMEMDLKYEDLTEKTNGEQEKRISLYLKEERERGFKSNEPPLTRGYLGKIGERKYKFIWTFQHSLIDGWSMNNIINDMMVIYHGQVSGEKVALEKIPYVNYILWLKKQDKQVAKNYWTDLFKGYKAGSKNQMLAKPVGEFQMESAKISFKNREMEKIKIFTAKYNITSNILFQTAWALTFRKITREEDLLLGLETSGRSAQLKDMVSMAGLFLSVLPYRADFREDMECLKWMMDLKNINLEMKKYEYVTMQDISRWTKIPMRELQEVTFDRTMVFQNFPNELKEAEKDFKISVDRKEAQLNIQLRLYIIPGDDYEVLISYNEKKYSRDEVKNMLDVYKTYITKLTENPEQSIGNIS